MPSRYASMDLQMECGIEFLDDVLVHRLFASDMTIAFSRFHGLIQLQHFAWEKQP